MISARLSMRGARRLIALAAIWLGALGCATSYDLVLQGGRVIDPETRLDAVRNVGIVDGTVAAISSERMQGAETLDVSGLIVAPGFIDTHSHASMTLAGQKYQARDGVTTALELEAGLYPLTESMAHLRGRATIHYGASAGYVGARSVAMGGLDAGFGARATDDEVTESLALVESALRDGAIGIGYLLDYVSEVVGDDELQRGFELAARMKVPLFVHIRRPQTAGDPSGLEEIIRLARETGASVQICHIGSNALRGAPGFLRRLHEAHDEGIDISAETYPYTAGSTFIGAAVWDRDWRTIYAIDYGDIEWAATGERMTEESWPVFHETYRADRTKAIIVHNNSEEALHRSLVDPLVMIGSDAMPMESMDFRAHPRTMGTFARFLGRYVRDEGLMDWPEAIRKTSLMPAQRLESFVPAMKRKGRLQIGSDADVTIFDPQSVIDRATFSNPNQFSEGIPHVLVGGEFVVRDGELIEDATPGQPVRSALPPGR